MDSAIHWTATKEPHAAREASLASMDAVCRKAKDEWLALFAADSVVEDPVGASMFDENGAGHHGHAGIGAFWDTAIAGVERFEFTVRDSFAAAWECANVGTISSFLPGGYRVDGRRRLRPPGRHGRAHPLHAGILGSRPRAGDDAPGLKSPSPQPVAATARPTAHSSGRASS